MRNDIEAVFQNIQGLEIRATENNVMLLADTMIRLKRIFDALQKEFPKIDIVPKNPKDAPAPEGEENGREDE